MIRFELKCDKDHRFESWFQSGAAFEKLSAGGMVACTTCGSTEVAKTVMAPAVSKAAPAKPSDAAMRDLRKKIEAQSDYVGASFAKVARDMHDGLTPERSIYGEANLAEARKLVEDGIPVMPLPFIPTKKTH